MSNLAIISVIGSTCTQNGDECTGVAHSSCMDDNGFTCTCDSGYYQSNIGTTCELSKLSLTNKKGFSFTLRPPAN